MLAAGQSFAFHGAVASSHHLIIDPRLLFKHVIAELDCVLLIGLVDVVEHFDNFQSAVDA